jgi:hypothetical protein
LYCGFYSKGNIYSFLDLGLEFDVQGWSYWYRMVLSIASFCPSIYYSWNSNDVSEQQQEQEQEGWNVQ